MFLYTAVLGILPRTAVRGLVTWRRILANDIATCNAMYLKNYESSKNCIKFRLTYFLVSGAYRNKKANLNRGENHPKEGSHASYKIKLIDLPYEDHGFMVQ